MNRISKLWDDCWPYILLLFVTTLIFLVSTVLHFGLRVTYRADKPEKVIRCHHPNLTVEQARNLEKKPKCLFDLFTCHWPRVVSNKVEWIPTDTITGYFPHAEAETIPTNCSVATNIVATTNAVRQLTWRILEREDGREFRLQRWNDHNMHQGKEPLVIFGGLEFDWKEFATVKSRREAEKMIRDFERGQMIATMQWHVVEER